MNPEQPEEQIQEANVPQQNYVPGYLNINNQQASDTQEITLLPSDLMPGGSGMLLALKDSKGKVIGENKERGELGFIGTPDPNPTIDVRGGKEVKLNLADGAKSAVASLKLKTDKDSKVILAGFSGQPPIAVGQGSNIAIADASQFIGFKPGQPGPDGKTVATSSKMEFHREQDGSITVMRDGQPVMNVPKDTKVEILDKNGKPLFTIDSSKDVDDLQKEYAKAEKKAFEQYQEASPDKSVRGASFRSGNEPPPPVQEGPAPNPLGSMGTAGPMVEQLAKQAMTGGTPNIGQTVQDTLVNNIPRLIPSGRGGIT